MKHFLVLLMAFSVITSCNNDKKEKDRGYDKRERDDYRAQEEKDKEPDTKNTDYKADGWTASDIRKMEEKCLESVDNNQAIADKFCPCVIEKMQRKYSSYEDLDTRGTEEEGRRIGEECKSTITGINTNTDTDEGGGWTSAEANTFVSNCVNSAVKEGMARSTASSYCSCMQEKLEKIYPVAANAAGIDVESPSMQRMMKGCLGVE